MRTLLITTIALVALGFAFMMAGLVYDIAFAGIPYQDPTPELAAQYAADSRVASLLFLIGGGLASLGALAAIVLAFQVVRRLWKPQEKTPRREDAA